MNSQLGFVLTIAVPLGIPVCWVLVRDLVDEYRRLRRIPARPRPAIPIPRTPLPLPAQPRHVQDEPEIDGPLIRPYVVHWQNQLDVLAERAATTARHAIRELAAAERA